MGGTESYYIRMFEWAKERGYKLFFFLPKGKEVHEKWFSSIKRLQISIVHYKKLGKRIIEYGELKKYLDDLSKQSMCITDSFDTFAAANNIFQCKSDKINILFYILHPFSTKLGKLNQLWARPILKGIKDSHLVFMDEETKDCVSKCYPEINFSNSEIIRLGMEIPPYNPEQRMKIYKEEIFTILTIARFDFPFKGYIAGLIDSYVNLRKRFNNITLTIVGDGAGKTELEQKINHISDASIISDIHMLGYLPYNEIQKYIEQASLFIGMGTTILDSAKYGVPGIVATAYQMEDYAAGFFHMDYTCIGRLIDEEGAKKYRFEELIEQIYAMSEEDYLKTCGDAYSLVHKHYGIENCMEQIMAMDAKRKIAPSFGITLFYNYMLPLWEKLKGAGDD